MKILITGAAGFIGGHLTQELIRLGHTCLGLDDLSIHNGKIPKWVELSKKNGAKWVLGGYADCANEWNIHTELKKFRPDTIFNLAVKPLPQSLEYPRDNFETNTKITANVLDWIRHNDVSTKLIHFSSSEVYGTAQEEIMDENHVLRPTTPYAAAKAACDHLVLSYVNTFGIDATIVRPFNTIGPRQNDKSYAAIIPKTMRRIKEGKKPIIFGDGSKTRDFTAVEDIVYGAIAAMMHGRRGEVYNLCSSVEISVSEMMDMISENMGYEGGYEYATERPGDVTRHLGNNNKASAELEWEPEIDIYEAVRRAING